MKRLFIVASCLTLGGCFFFMFPIPKPGTFSGNACVGTAAHVGQQLKHTDGRIGTVKTIYGASDRCRENQAMPILAEVEYDTRTTSAPAFEQK